MGETYYLVCDTCLEHIHLWKEIEIKINRCQTDIMVDFLLVHKSHNVRFIGEYAESDIEVILNDYENMTKWFEECRDENP